MRGREKDEVVRYNTKGRLAAALLIVRLKADTTSAGPAKAGHYDYLSGASAP
jgi:hypothetical protein